MRSNKSTLTFVILVTMVFASKAQKHEFPLDEKLHYQLNYGWFSLGEAIINLDDSLHYTDGQPYYKTSVEAGTIGLFSWLAGIDNTFMGYVNTKNYRSTYNEKKIRERKENYDQWNAFDYTNMKVYAKVEDYLDEEIETFEREIDANTYDMMGTYLFLRSQKWEGAEVGDSLFFKTFYHKRIYDFGMEYAGEERIKFEGNKFNTSKFYILFPVTKTFPKPKAVTVWVTKRNGINIPLKIEANLKIGKVVCELTSYSVKGKDTSGLFKD